MVRKGSPKKKKASQSKRNVTANKSSSRRISRRRSRKLKNPEIVDFEIDYIGAPGEGEGPMYPPATPEEIANFYLDAHRDYATCQAKLPSGNRCKKPSALGKVLCTRYGDYTMCGEHLKIFGCSCAHKGLNYLAGRTLVDPGDYFAIYPEWGDAMIEASK